MLSQAKESEKYFAGVKNNAYICIPFGVMVAPNTFGGFV